MRRYTMQNFSCNPQDWCDSEEDFLLASTNFCCLLSADNLLHSWTQIRTDRMSVLIGIQTLLDSDSISERYV